MYSSACPIRTIIVGYGIMYIPVGRFYPVCTRVKLPDYPGIVCRSKGTKYYPVNIFVGMVMGSGT